MQKTMPPRCLVLRHSLLTLDVLKDVMVALRRQIDGRKKFCNDLKQIVMRKMALFFLMIVPGKYFEQLMFLYRPERPLPRYPRYSILLRHQRSEAHLL